MREHEATMLQTWITAFEEKGGGVIRLIEKKKEIFGLLKQWHSVFDDCRDSSIREFPKSSSIFLVSLFGDPKLPTHRRSGLTFALELIPPDVWYPDVRGIPGEFVLFDSNFRWTVVVTHEESKILFS